MHSIGRFELDVTELGSGGYGAVYRGKDTSTGGLVAVKVVSHSKMRLSAIQHEVKLMKKLRHKHIIALIEHIQLEDQTFIVMELASNGELFSRVIDKGNLDEPEARRYFAQMLSSLEYLHSMGIVHRDLKLENVLLDAADDCKICDFGLAHQYDLDDAGKIIKTPLHDICGSKSYAAPEVLAGRGYDGLAADVWSCGICLFAMLAGFFPLDGATQSDWRFTRVLQAVAQGESLTHTIFGFYSRPCVMSDEAVSLIDSMMNIYHSGRITISDALAHPWITGRAKTVTITAHTHRHAKEMNAKYDAFEGPQYRSPHYAEVNSLGLQMSMDLDRAADGAGFAPVYRGAEMLAGPNDTPPRMPALKRQPAFGAAPVH